MKKIILTAAAVFAFGFTNAQDVKFGVKGGLNVANFSGDVEGNSSLVGFHIGGFAEIKVSEKFALQPELLFSSQGADGDGGNFDLSYINVPVMAKFFLVDKFSIEAGPQIGFLTSAKAKVDGGESADVKKLFKSTDFGFNFGAGYDFTDNFSVGARYNLGLSNLFNKDFEDLLGGEAKVHNSVFLISLGYKF